MGCLSPRLSAGGLLVAAEVTDALVEALVLLRGTAAGLLVQSWRVVTCVRR